MNVPAMLFSDSVNPLSGPTPAMISFPAFGVPVCSAKPDGLLLAIDAVVDTVGLDACDVPVVNGTVMVPRLVAGIAPLVEYGTVMVTVCLVDAVPGLTVAVIVPIVNPEPVPEIVGVPRVAVDDVDSVKVCVMTIVPLEAETVVTVLPESAALNEVPEPEMVSDAVPPKVPGHDMIQSANST